MKVSMIRFLVLFFSVSLWSFENLPFHEDQFDARYDAIKANRDGKRIFIETGTAGGMGVCMAIFAGFEEMYSAEVDPTQFNLGADRFAKEEKIHLFLGDSSTALMSILASIHEPALFWLDAHYCGNAPQYFEKCPILRELAAIGDHSIKTHTLLIDDVRLFGTPEFDNISVADLIAAIKRINPDYEVTFADGYAKNDVLVAKVR